MRPHYIRRFPSLATHRRSSEALALREIVNETHIVGKDRFVTETIPLDGVGESLPKIDAGGVLRSVVALLAPVPVAPLTRERARIRDMGYSGDDTTDPGGWTLG